MNRFLRVSLLPLVATILCLGATQATAQVQLAGGLGISKATNYYMSDYYPGLGVDLRLRWLVSDYFGIGLNTGYYGHGYRGNGYDYWYRYGYTPIAGAFNFYVPVTSNFRLYAGAEAGFYSFFNSWWEYNEDPYYDVVYYSSAIRPGIGVEAGMQVDVAGPLFLYGNGGLRGVFQNGYWGYDPAIGLLHFSLGAGVTIY